MTFKRFIKEVERRLLIDIIFSDGQSGTLVFVDGTYEVTEGKEITLRDYMDKVTIEDESPTIRNHVLQKL